MIEINDTYATVSKIGEGFYKEKGSKFLGFAFPCKAAENAKAIIDRLRKEHHGACHVCFAWRFGTEKYADRYSDDGEPNNSAGKPIFGQILSAEITNVMVAVVRYYGGTNLGVGGLINAYKTAAKDAILTANVKEYYIKNTYKLSHTFSNTGSVMSALNRINAEITEQLFTDQTPIIIFKLRKSKEKEIERMFNDIPNSKITPVKTAN